MCYALYSVTFNGGTTMSVQITTAFVEQYKSNVFHLAQQKGSKLISKQSDWYPPLLDHQETLSNTL